MAYSFDLRQVCGGYAYFSTFTQGNLSEQDRYEIREPSQVDPDIFTTALQEIGQTFQLVDSNESYQHWLYFQGWAVVRPTYARTHMQQWLKQHKCIRSALGSFTDIEIASPGVTQRTRRGAAKQQILQRDADACLICTAKENLTLQHVWPFSAGGETSSRNMVTLCGDCNQRLRDEINIGLYQLARLHNGYEPSLIKGGNDIQLAIDRATYLSNNLMHTRCDLW